MRPANKRATRVLNLVVGAALAIVLVGTLLEASLDYVDVSLDVASLAQNSFRPEFFGVGLVAIEEAGLPLPISGDLLIRFAVLVELRDPERRHADREPLCHVAHHAGAAAQTNCLIPT